VLADRWGVTDAEIARRFPCDDVVAHPVLSYVLVPEADTTRLLLKVATARFPVLAPFISVGDLVMARRQLRNLKQLAESG
jgi:hypothetical protein